jgi:hypothetical protein
LAASPSQRTLERLRKDGYIAQVVEKRVPFRNITQDLFGCIDILAVKPGHPVLGVQATTVSNQSARYKKSIAIPELRVWLEAGCRFEVWGWAQSGKEGKRKLWTPSIRNVRLVDLDFADKERNQPS